jgi:hypothetical protein
MQAFAACDGDLQSPGWLVFIIGMAYRRAVEAPESAKMKISVGWGDRQKSLSYLDRISTRVATNWALSLNLPWQITCLPTITSSMEPGLF